MSNTNNSILVTREVENEEELMANLDNFILACLKEYSKNGSLTKTEMKKWFNDTIDRVVNDAQQSLKAQDL
ncbi:hypothetical protein LCGC14_0372870 [marine sediment metagenome]|uniref:Uncharacterized protein n=1 Tax=marine sediment metagenome TaxID=412755 RepID=A0A0F9VS31_9ZZZZ